MKNWNEHTLNESLCIVILYIINVGKVNKSTAIIIIR